jgi:hypothetical protein
MKRIREQAAGIDIGAKKVFVSVEGQEVKNFLTFTEDFEQLRDYLLKLLGELLYLVQILGRGNPFNFFENPVEM